MMIRDEITALTMPGQQSQQWLGDAETDFSYDSSLDAINDPWANAIKAIRAISVPMGYLRQQIDATLGNVANADINMSDADLNTLQANVQQMAQYAIQLPALIAAAKALPEYRTDAQTAGELNNWLAFLQSWAGSSVAVLGMLPTDLANYLGQQIANIGKAATGAATGIAFSLLPLVAIVLGVAYFAEQSRTYRKVVA
jgi:hypothetical protein